MFFFHLTEAFPCREATITSCETNILLEKIIPIWGTHFKPHSVQGSYFTGQVLGYVCAI